MGWKEFKGMVFRGKRPKCPMCNRLMHWRKRADAWVCRNWKCELYWKRGIGWEYHVRRE